MLTKSNLLRQAEWLLKLAHSAADPGLAATLVRRAADLKERADQSDEPDLTPQAPDIVRELDS